MQRATVLDTSLRTYTGAGARGCAHEADDTKLIQEVKVNFLKDETRDKVERPQPYGFTGYFVKAEYKNGLIEKCAEHFTQFMGANRSLPVCASLDDRRYRLHNFKEGETAIYDDQQQKVHLQRDRIYTRSEYKVEMRVIKDQKYMDGHGKDQSASRDQQADKSRRWSTYVMDKDSITIERTNIVNDDDGDDPNKHTQDEPEQHIKMLSRVYLDAMHINILTPTISILWDEEKKFLKLNTGRNTITLEDVDEPTGGKRILITTPERSIVIDDKAKAITISGTTTAIKVDDNAGKTRVGDIGASIPAAHLGSFVSSGDYICGNVAKKVLVI